jgi:hypothetical protein
MTIHTIGDIYLHDAGEEPEEVRGVVLIGTTEEVQALGKLMAGHETFTVVPVDAMLGLDTLIKKLSGDVERLRTLATAAGLEVETP